MNERQILESLKILLQSLNEEELRQIIPASFLNQNSIKQYGEGEKNQNILNKLKYSSSEKIRNAKDFISKKIKINKSESDTDYKKEENQVLNDNPFLKYKQEHPDNFSENKNE